MDSSLRFWGFASGTRTRCSVRPVLTEGSVGQRRACICADRSGFCVTLGNKPTRLPRSIVFSLSLFAATYLFLAVFSLHSSFQSAQAAAPGIYLRGADERKPSENRIEPADASSAAAPPRSPALHLLSGLSPFKSSTSTASPAGSPSEPASQSLSKPAAPLLKPTHSRAPLLSGKKAERHPTDQKADSPQENEARPPLLAHLLAPHDDALDTRRTGSLLSPPPSSATTPPSSASGSPLAALSNGALEKNTASSSATSRKPFPSLLPRVRAKKGGASAGDQEGTKREVVTLPEEFRAPRPVLATRGRSLQATDYEAASSAELKATQERGFETLQALLAQAPQTQTVPVLPLKVLEVEEETQTPEPCACDACQEDRGGEPAKKEGGLGPPCVCESCLRKAAEEERKKAEEEEARRKAEEEEKAQTPDEAEKEEEERKAEEGKTADPSVEPAEDAHEGESQQAQETTSSSSAAPDLNVKGTDISPRAASAALSCAVSTGALGVAVGTAVVLQFF
ncbi:hypothetical protein BESB_020810 [Besnoitia besnoiti]|uniref:Transmembrane protein n=1 Tax=Besnoitia besnoiti TaxID=94643 RepID=A0A2A9M9T7_BESBE|nr:hypothetical protein BESB_020810 [Besnoitia besnoiti]PFH32140.1 hypothetical protein BESB_020810 [Besnoitia besnoiti]